MGEHLSTAAVLLFLIVIAGVGYGIYRIMGIESQLSDTDGECDCDEPGVTNSYYTEIIENHDINFSSASTEERTLDVLETTIKVEKGEWVYISFVTSAQINPSDTLRHAMQFFFTIDGVAQYPGFSYEESLDTASDDDIEYVPISIFAVFDDVDAGTHDICIMIYISYNPCPAEIGSSSLGTALLVQTLNP